MQGDALVAPPRGRASGLLRGGMTEKGASMRGSSLMRELCVCLGVHMKWCHLLRSKGQCYRVDVGLHFSFLMFFFSKSFFPPKPLFLNSSTQGCPAYKFPCLRFQVVTSSRRVLSGIPNTWPCWESDC